MNHSQHGRLNYVPIFESASRGQQTFGGFMRYLKVRLRPVSADEPKRFYSAAGLSAVEIARLLEVHAHTIYADLHAFDIYGVTAVYRLGQGGAPQQITPCPTRRSVAAG